MDRKASAHLSSVSPLDGRYFSKIKVLQEYFSEKALIKKRLLIEVLYLVELVEFLGLKKISKRKRLRMERWVRELTDEEIARVKIIERKLNHDVKAAEYFLRDSLDGFKLVDLKPWVHWGLTSEDVNNLAYGLMLKDCRDEVLFPKTVQLIKVLLDKAEEYADLAMPARTHGQLAVPTTLGKEIVVFVTRASFFAKKIGNLYFNGKLNGAVGNYNSQVKIYPNKNWVSFSKKFINKLGLKPSLITTQIEPGFKMVYFFDLIRQLNNVWLDLARDFWLYICFDYLVQENVKQEVGSSTMPHKVNPIDFENAEGNLEIANGLLTVLSNELPISRMQRDLSDSTVKRNMGVAIGHSMLAIEGLMKGLKKITANKKLLGNEVEKHPEMLSEALQLYLKTKGNEEAYELIKNRVRGKKVGWEEVIVNLGKKHKKFVRVWRGKDYIGLAEKLTRREIRRIRNLLNIN